MVNFHIVLLEKSHKDNSDTYVKGIPTIEACSPGRVGGNNWLLGFNLVGANQ